MTAQAAIRAPKCGMGSETGWVAGRLEREKPLSCTVCEGGKGPCISDLSGLVSGFLLLRQLMTIDHQDRRFQWKMVVLPFEASYLALSLVAP